MIIKYKYTQSNRTNGITHDRNRVQLLGYGNNMLLIVGMGSNTLEYIPNTNTFDFKMHNANAEVLDQMSNR